MLFRSRHGNKVTEGDTRFCAQSFCDAISEGAITGNTVAVFVSQLPLIACFEKHGEKRAGTTGPPPPGASVAEQMRHKLRTAEGQAVYKLRKAVVEPVFGQIKEARGFRRFLLRGLEKVQAEWQMICATHNLLKLFRSAWRPQRA